MKNKPYVSFITKLLSKSHYLNEVTVENKKYNHFYRRFCSHDQYARLLIRNGSCITLLSHSIAINIHSFWHIMQFEEMVRYVFWTFNKSFLLLITDNIPALSVRVRQRYLELLTKHPVAFSKEVCRDADEEVLWCLQKNSYLRRDARFEGMYRLDREHRTVILNSLQEVDQSCQNISCEIAVSPNSLTSAAGLSTNGEIVTPATFFHLLKPIQKSGRSTLEFIQSSLIAAGFTFDLFSPVAKVENGKNTYGLNGQIAAMIDFFFQHNYFMKEVDQRQLFKAYFQYSGNCIPKLGHYYAQFRADPTYIRYFNKLKALKISKL